MRLFAENKSVQNADVLSAALTEERAALALHELQQGELQQHTPSARTPAASAPVGPGLPPPQEDEPTPSQNTAFQEICPAGEKTTAPLKIPAKVSVGELCGENTAHSTERQLNRLLLQRGRGPLCSGRRERITHLNYTSLGTDADATSAKRFSGILQRRSATQGTRDEVEE